MNITLPICFRIFINYLIMAKLYKSQQSIKWLKIIPVYPAPQHKYTKENVTTNLPNGKNILLSM